MKKAKSMKGLRGIKLLEHLYEYYKLPIGLLLVGIYIIIYIIFRMLTAKEMELYVGFINVSAGEDLHQTLITDFVPYLDTGNPKSDVYTYDGLMLTSNPDSESITYIQASQMKIMAAIEAKQLDVVLLDQEAFDAFSQSGFLYNMEDYIADNVPSLAEELQPYLVDNIEILDDNTDEMYFHPEVQYESEITEYPMGLKLTFCDAIEEAGFPQDIYLAVIRNSERGEHVGKYIEYLWER